MNRDHIPRISEIFTRTKEVIAPLMLLATICFVLFVAFSINTAGIIYHEKTITPLDPSARDLSMRSLRGR